MMKISNTSIMELNSCCQHRQRTCYRVQTGINVLLKFSLFILLIVCLYVSEVYQSPKFPRNGNPLSLMNSKQGYYELLLKTKRESANTDEFSKTQKAYSQPGGRTQKYQHSYYSENGNPQGKFWTRISDEVFVYSAHLDTRNFTTLSPMLNNISLGIDGRVLNARNGGQRVAGDDDDSNDSDKLKHIILIRIVGMKAVPPLREFLKRDVLDWFRIKNEMEYSQKYSCKLFFTSSSTNNFESIQSTRVTYTVIEEGVKIYASCYFNCYFTIRSSIFQIVNAAVLADDLHLSMHPTDVADYPTKLIKVETLMMNQAGNNSSSSINFHQRSLSVCVRPLFGPFDDLEKLIQFINYYQAVGITQFNFYSMSISSRVRKYFWELIMIMSKETIGEKQTFPRFILHDWNVPTGNTSELWDYGTLAALNDCLLANVDQEYVAFVDVDEFIVPRPNSSSDGNSSDDANQSTLWKIIDSYNKTTTYQYLVRNTFFCHEFCNEFGGNTKNYMNFSSLLSETSASTLRPDVTSIPTASSLANNSLAEILMNMPIFRCFLRTKRVWNAALRSKFIVNPREVLAVGHHLVTKYVKKVDFRFSSHSVQVDPQVGILHHYRECKSISSKKHPVLTRIREMDKTMLKFRWGVYDSLLRYNLYSNQ